MSHFPVLTLATIKPTIWTVWVTYQFKTWTSPRFLVLFYGKTGKMPLNPCSFLRQNRKNAFSFFLRLGRLHDSLFFSMAKQEKCL